MGDHASIRQRYTQNTYLWIIGTVIFAMYRLPPLNTAAKCIRVK